MCLSRLKGFGIQSSVRGFDSRLIDVIDVIDIIPMKFSPVIRKTHIVWYTVLTNAIAGIAIEIALAI
jgi:hypothetical protein